MILTTGLALYLFNVHPFQPMGPINLVDCGHISIEFKRLFIIELKNYLTLQNIEKSFKFMAADLNTLKKV